MGRYLAPLMIGILGAAILCALGIWQVQRLGQKQAFLADIEARIGAAPVALPTSPAPAGDRYLPVRASGRFTGEGLRVLFSIKGVGAAHRLISVFETDGRRVLVDRGYAPPPVEPGRAGPAMVIGNLHWPDETDGFTPEPELSTALWFARDVTRMASHFDTEPVLIVAREIAPADSGLTPLAVGTEGIPNDHLQYAVTWFGLAIVWTLMSGYWIVRTRRGPRSTQ